MRALTEEENDALFHEVKSMMEEAENDDDQRPLSSDEEGYVDGLMEGRIARPAASSSRGQATAAADAPDPRKDSVASIGGQGFQARLLAAFDGLQPGLTGYEF